MVKGEKLVREGGYTITGGSRFGCSNQKIAPPMPKSVSGITNHANRCWRVNAKEPSTKRYL